jgi:hypothetical protein
VCLFIAWFVWPGPLLLLLGPFMCPPVHGAPRNVCLFVCVFFGLIVGLVVGLFGGWLVVMCAVCVLSVCAVLV